MDDKPLDGEQPVSGPGAAPESVGVESPGSKRLYRSRRDRILAGVCGGLGHYLAVDPVWIRIATVVVILLPGIGIFTVGLGYLIAMLVMPEEPVAVTGSSPPPADVATPTRPAEGSDRGHVIVGGFLVGIGVLLLARIYVPEVFSTAVLAPIALIAVGLLVVIQGARR